MASRLKVIYSTEKRGRGTQETTKELQGLEGVVKKTQLAFGALAGGAAIGAALAGLKAVRDVVMSAINPTVELAGQVRELGAFAGVSAQEASKLIQVADDMGIEFGTLQQAAKGMAEEGLQPSIDTLADLADQFRGMQDPVQRADFLLETFGARAGPQMAELMQQGGDAIRAMAQEAEDAGLVMDEKAVKAAREYELALDSLGDRALALKLVMGNAAIPVITDTIGVFEKLIDAVELGLTANRKYEVQQGRLVKVEQTRLQGLRDLGIVMTGQDPLFNHAANALMELVEANVAATSSTRAQSDAILEAGGYLVDFTGSAEGAAAILAKLEGEQLALNERMGTFQTILAGAVDKEMDAFEKKQGELRDRASELQGQIDGLNGKTYLTDAQREQLEDWQTELGDVQTEMGKTADAHNEATMRILLDMAIQEAARDGFTAGEEAFLKNLATQWGLQGKATELAIFGIGDALQAVADDNLPAAQREMQELLDQFGLIPPDGKSWTYHFFLNTYGTVPGPSSLAGDPSTATPPVPMAHGGDFIVPPGFWRDNFPIGVSSGERVIVQTPEQQRAGGAPGGDTYNVTIYAGNANAQQLMRMLRDGDIRRRTGARG